MFHTPHRVSLLAAAAGLSAAALLAAPAKATITISGPLTAAGFTSLNTGANYGPPSPAHFTEPGPITVDSGTSTTLYAGPKPGASKADTALLVLSASAADVAKLGSITLTFDALTPITFHASDFFTDAQTGFTSMIGGIGNGAVNGIKFTDSLHAAVDLSFGDLIHNLYGADVAIDDVTITSPINLRVDVFGDHDGKIVNNASNSGALGITGDAPPPVPEPTTLALLAAGIVGLGFVRSAQRTKT